MLDQNTDRMWFVIGAVIVGAAIIFIANGTLPTLFASVSDSFEESANKGTEVIEMIGEQEKYGLLRENTVVREPFVMRDLMPWVANSVTFLSDTALTIQNNPESYHGGVYFTSDHFEMGETYTIKFTMQKLSGNVGGLGGHITIANVVETYIDGVEPPFWEKGYGGAVMSKAPWGASLTYPNDTLKHEVEVTFKRVPSKGGNENVFIQPNRVPPAEYKENALDYKVLLENVELYRHVEKEGE